MGKFTNNDGTINWEKARQDHEEKKVKQKERLKEFILNYITKGYTGPLEITSLDAEIIWDMFKKEKEVE